MNSDWVVLLAGAVMLCIFIVATLAGIARRERDRAACEASGGTYVYSRDSMVRCFSRGAVIAP